MTHFVGGIDQGVDFALVPGLVVVDPDARRDLKVVFSSFLQQGGQIDDAIRAQAVGFFSEQLEVSGDFGCARVWPGERILSAAVAAVAEPLDAERGIFGSGAAVPVCLPQQVLDRGNRGGNGDGDQEAQGERGGLFHGCWIL